MDSLLLWGGELAIVGVALLMVKDRAAQVAAESTPALSSQLALGKKVRLSGRLCADVGLLSPLSKTPCAAWKLAFIIEEQDGKERVRSVGARAEGQGAGVALVDAAGSVPLACMGGRLVTHRHHSVGADRADLLISRHVPFELRPKVVAVAEHWMCIGEEVTVTGVAESYDGVLFVGGVSEFEMQNETSRPTAPPGPFVPRILGAASLALGVVLLAGWFFR